MSANVAYAPHPRSHQHQQPPYSHPYSHHPADMSPTMAHESLSSKSGPVSPLIDPLHPLYISTSPHHHHQQPQQQYHHGPYQVPSPPYSSHPPPPPQHRSSSVDISQKPTLPYPSRHPQHSYSSSAHRSHPYSPPTLPPITGRPPLSPQSPVDSYSAPSNNRDDHLQYHRGSESSMSASPPPSSSNGNGGGVALSASDRRERNKAASAKYRAKKHHQSGEMRTQISALQDHNNVLVRQLEECRAENAQLKNQVEKLKGRLVAEKVLKRLREVGREKKRRNSGNAGHSTSKASAHDLSMTDSDDDDDVVNAVAAANQDIEDEEEEEEEEERRHNEKSNSRRKIARTDRHSDEDYREV